MRKLTEQEEKLVSNIDDKITEILENLRDGVFRNSESRQEFTKLLVQLALSKDPRARKAIKSLGDYLTDLGHEILGTTPEIEAPEVVKIDANEIAGTDHNKIDLGLNEKKYKKYISLFNR